MQCISEFYKFQNLRKIPFSFDFCDTPFEIRFLPFFYCLFRSFFSSKITKKLLYTYIQSSPYILTLIYLEKKGGDKIENFQSLIFVFYLFSYFFFSYVHNIHSIFNLKNRFSRACQCLNYSKVTVFFLEICSKIIGEKTQFFKCC